jgi:uncharacterized membrane protein
MIAFTVLNIVLTETIFYLAEILIKKKKLSCIITLFLGLYVMLMCFGGSVASLLMTMAEDNGKIEISMIVLFVADLFYSYLRGLRRISTINKKYGNL